MHIVILTTTTKTDILIELTRCIIKLA